MHTLPPRLDRSGRVIGAARRREERPHSGVTQGSPSGLRPPDAGGPLQGERPVLAEPRHEADRPADGRCESVEGAICRARAQHSAKARDFSYPMSPSRRIHCVRRCQLLFRTHQHTYWYHMSSVDRYRKVVSSTGPTTANRSLPCDRGPTRRDRGQRHRAPDSDRGVTVPADSRPGTKPPAFFRRDREDRTVRSVAGTASGRRLRPGTSERGRSSLPARRPRAPSGGGWRDRTSPLSESVKHCLGDWSSCFTNWETRGGAGESGKGSP